MKSSDTDYARVLAMYRAALPAGRTFDFRIDGNDHLGIPVVDATFVPADGQHHYYGVGYGATEAEAMVGAYGELCEDAHHAATFRGLSPKPASYRQLCAELGAERVLDPVSFCLPAGSPYTEDTELRWVEITRLRDGERVWAPAEFVASFSGDFDFAGRLTVPITNGNGAGDTLERALLHGLLELLQRDGNADSFRALDRGRVIARADVPAEAGALVDELAGKGLEVIPKLARVTCGCASVYAVGRDSSDDAHPMSVTACGEAADPDFATAIRKAVLECASSHSRKLFYHSSFARKAEHAPPGYADEQRRLTHLDAEEPRALRAVHDWLNLTREELYAHLEPTVFSERERVDVSRLPTFAPTSVEERMAHVRELIEAEGLEIYYHEATTTGGKVRVVKAIVPGIEMELGSYHRIGARGVARLIDRDDRLVSREPAPGRERILLTAADEARLGGPFFLEVEKLDALVGDLYALYREPSSHAAAYAKEIGYFETAKP